MTGVSTFNNTDKGFSNSHLNAGQAGIMLKLAGWRWEEKRPLAFTATFSSKEIKKGHGNHLVSIFGAAMSFVWAQKERKLEKSTFRTSLTKLKAAHF